MKRSPGIVNVRNTCLEITQQQHFGPGATQLSAAVRAKLDLAIPEAFDCLRRAGLTTEDVDQSYGGWVVLSRRGRAVEPDGFRDFIKGLQLPIEILHSLIRTTVAKAFARGEPDVAVHQAFKHVEVEVREAARLPADLLGVKLIR